MKRRLNLIIGKKQIILACLTVLLGVAIYVNYLAASGSSIETANKVEDSASNYGDVQFVSTDTENDTKDVSADVEGLNQSEEVSAEIDVSSSDEYFAQARLDKQASRDEAVEMLKSMYNGGDSTAD
ncbi:MAG: SpoIIIAH-like family protein, partial [Ruminiclostridium sp.]